MPEQVHPSNMSRPEVGPKRPPSEAGSAMCKGTTKAMHVEAGLRVKQAEMELSAHYMPGLGGVTLLHENAIETGELMRQVAPDYIRLRSLALRRGTPLADDMAARIFTKATDLQTAEEILLFLEHVGDIPSRLVSDHILNLFSSLNGDLATRRQSLMAEVREFLELDPHRQRLFMLGRQMGILVRLEDLDTPIRGDYAEAAYRRLRVTEENADAILQELANQYI